MSYRFRNLAWFGLACLLAARTPVAADELHMLAAWNADYTGVDKLARRYVGMVAEATSGRVNIAIIGPDAVPAFEQLTPTVLGIFDLLFTHGMFHLDTTAMGVALDTITADPASLREAGIWAAVDAHYQAHGLKLLAMPSLRPGYDIMLRRPLDDECSLDGRRIRAAPVHHGLLAALGASVTIQPAQQVQAALGQDDIDGVAWPRLNVLDYPWYTAAPYVLQPAFGNFTYLVLMNLDAWNRLDHAVQDILVEQGVVLEVRAWKRAEKWTGRMRDGLAAQHVQDALLCDDTAASVARHWAAGAWALAEAREGEVIRHLHELAIAAGLTP